MALNITIGKRIYYVISTPAPGQFILGSLNPDGTLLVQKADMHYMQLLIEVDKTVGVQNASIKDGQLVLANQDYTSKDRTDILYYQENAICLAEITEEDNDNVVAYILVDRFGQQMVAQKLVFKKLVVEGKIDNYYYSPAIDTVKRKPNQEIMYGKMVEARYKDTRPDIREQDMLDLMRVNKFKLAYKSDKYTLTFYRGTSPVNKVYYSQAFYTPDGAVLWENVCCGEGNKETIPFPVNGMEFLIMDVDIKDVNGCIGLVGTVVTPKDAGKSMMMLIQSHQGMIEMYNSVRKSARLVSPWRVHPKEWSEYHEPIDSVHRADYYYPLIQKLDEWKQMKVILDIGEPILLESAHLIAMYRTLKGLPDSVPQEFKNIFSNWFKYYMPRLEADIGKALVSCKIRFETVEEFLRIGHAKTNHTLEEIVDMAIAQRIKDGKPVENPEELKRKIFNPYVHGTIGPRDISTALEIQKAEEDNKIKLAEQQAQEKAERQAQLQLEQQQKASKGIKGLFGMFSRKNKDK